MMFTTGQSLAMIIVIAIATFLTRVVPFVLFPDGKQVPQVIVYLGTVLPYAMMAMLVVYCLKGVSVFEGTRGIPELISILYVAIVHKWKHNLILSIGGGTLLYMILIQYVFV